MTKGFCKGLAVVGGACTNRRLTSFFMEGPEPQWAPAPSHESFGYESRSLRLAFFSLALAFLWSERPSRFLLLSPVRAPPASFMRPLALSIFASFLSSLLLLVGTGVRSSPRRHSLLVVLDALKPGSDTPPDLEGAWALCNRRAGKGL